MKLYYQLRNYYVKPIVAVVEAVLSWFIAKLKTTSTTSYRLVSMYREVFRRNSINF